MCITEYFVEIQVDFLNAINPSKIKMKIYSRLWGNVVSNGEAQDQLC